MNNIKILIFILYNSITHNVTSEQIIIHICYFIGQFKIEEIQFGRWWVDITKKHMFIFHQIYSTVHQDCRYRITSGSEVCFSSVVSTFRALCLKFGCYLY